MTEEQANYADVCRNDLAAAADARSPCIESRWDRPVVAHGGGEATLLVRIVAPAADEAEAGRAAPLDVAFVLDRSGSMHGGKLELAKDGVDLAVARLRDADRAALVAYDNEVDTVQPLAAATPRHKAALRLALHGVDAGGSTFLSGGWVAGCHQIAEAPSFPGQPETETRIRRVILLTDGLANVGVLDPGELARHAGELRRRGIATTTVGVGQDFDEGLLSAMAEAGGGNFEYIADPEALRTFFACELKELFTVAATGLTVTVRLPAGLRADLVSAFPVEADGERTEVAVGDLPAGDEIDLVFAIRVNAGSIGDELPATIAARWTDPRADARHEVDASPVALLRVSAEEVEAVTPDSLVAERGALQRAAAERRAGLELDRAGRIRESRDRMARAYHLLAAAPRTESVSYDLRETEALAFMAADASYSPHLRKTAQHREGQRRRGRADRPPGTESGE